MPNDLHFPPNVPVLLALVDPEGHYDLDMRQGTYQTTTGQTFVLPRPAVVQLNLVEPRPSEEIQITRIWKGRRLDPVEWVICLSPRSEQARAREEAAIPEAGETITLAEALEESITRAHRAKPLKTPPTLVKRPIQSERGTGTDGPAPALQPTTKRGNGVIPWNVAFREVSRWVSAELAANQLQWSDASQQDLVSTVLIAEVKAGRIGPWERPE
jgi:hypothetical protein